MQLVSIANDVHLGYCLVCYSAPSKIPKDSRWQSCSLETPCNVQQNQHFAPHILPLSRKWVLWAMLFLGHCAITSLEVWSALSSCLWNLISMQGALLVTLKEAKNLPAADSNGLSDPYAVLKLGKEKRQSMIQYDTLNPVWNEKFDFVKVPSHLKETSVSLGLLMIHDLTSVIQAPVIIILLQ